MSGSKSSAPTAVPAKANTDHPLGLTIHSIPAPEQAAQADTQRTRSGRLKMLLLLLICASPVLASYFTYYVIRPEGRRNHGELIDPQRELPQGQARLLSGETVPLSSLKGQWLLVSVAEAACDKSCEHHLYLQRQLRESLGKDKDRLDWVWLIPGDDPVPDRLQPALAQATVLRVDPSLLQRWLQPAEGHTLNEHLYVVDPMGNWMMRFNAGLDLKGASQARRDLERLLRASSSWDQAGRP